jgi:hypothetical protein
MPSPEELAREKIDALLTFYFGISTFYFRKAIQRLYSLLRSYFSTTNTHAAERNQREETRGDSSVIDQPFSARPAPSSS